MSTARRANAPVIERLSYGAMGGCSSRLYLSQDRQNIGCEGVRSLPVCGHALCLRIRQISAVSRLLLQKIVLGRPPHKIRSILWLRKQRSGLFVHTPRLKRKNCALTQKRRRLWQDFKID
jgi:hypothetical protein